MVSMSWDLNLLDMSLRVMIEKVMLVLYIRNLEEDTLARKIYEEQKKYCWPGLAQETKLICQELDIEDVNDTQEGRISYKKLLIKACHLKNENNLRLQAKGKCERIVHESYGKKEYTEKKNIHSVRQMYRSRFGLQPFAGNYSHDRKYSKSAWLCKCLEAREEEAHLLSGTCKVYGDIALKYDDIMDDENLVQLFSEILARRDQLDKEN